MSIYDAVKTSVSSLSTPKPPKKAKIRGIEIDRADNGYVVTTRYFNNPSPKKGMDSYVEPTRKVYESASKMAEHVATMDDE